jgi:hypothetical protein
MWCLLLLFILLIMLLKPKPEGFGTYDYLSPIPIGIKWDQNTIQKFVDKYNTTKKFSNMGETETYLVNNFVGTDKIKERINS